MRCTRGARSRKLCFKPRTSGVQLHWGRALQERCHLSGQLLRLLCRVVGFLGLCWADTLRPRPWNESQSNRNQLRSCGIWRHCHFLQLLGGRFSWVLSVGVLPSKLPLFGHLVALYEALGAFSSCGRRRTLLPSGTSTLDGVRLFLTNMIRSSLFLLQTSVSCGLFGSEVAVDSLRLKPFSGIWELDKGRADQTLTAVNNSRSRHLSAEQQLSGYEHASSRQTS